jgi:putative ABC transport system permease protein
LLSTILGVLLAIVFLPAFNEFTHKGIGLAGQSILMIIVLGTVLALAVGLLAGFYPAWVLSSFRAAAVLKGNLVSKLKTDFVKPLVVLQFAFSAFLIISSIIMYRQMEFLLSKDLGYNKNQVVVISLPSGGLGSSGKDIDRLRTEFEKEPGIVSVACASNSFAHGYGRQGWKLKNGESRSAYVYNVDENYLSTLGIEIKEGRNFDSHIASDSNAVIVNEALVKAMGWDNPTAEYLNFMGDSTARGSRVIGVTRDYNFQTLEEGIGPMFIRMAPGYRNILIKIKKGDTAHTLEVIRNTWSSVLPGKPFDYTFLDQDVARQYESHQQWMNIMEFSTGFAIVISCMGLFGLSGMNALNKTKEIGIRKVMGAAIIDMFILLNKQFVLLAMLAFLLAIPFSIYATNVWLSKFEYAITPGWEIFAITMALALVVSLLTVSYHGIRASLINPADTLKYE